MCKHHTLHTHECTLNIAYYTHAHMCTYHTCAHTTLYSHHTPQYCMETPRFIHRAYQTYTHIYIYLHTSVIAHTPCMHTIHRCTPYTYMHMHTCHPTHRPTHAIIHRSIHILPSDLYIHHIHNPHILPCLLLHTSYSHTVLTQIYMHSQHTHKHTH